MPALGAVAMETQVQEQLRSIVLSVMLSLLHSAGICLLVREQIGLQFPVPDAFCEFLFLCLHRTQAQIWRLQ